jgi:MYXO-CTERM domain-containing protein
MKFTLTLATLLFLAVPARGADAPCTVDSDCAKGQVCMAAPCSVPACAPDSDCPDATACDVQGFCVAAPWDGSCAADADCPTGFTCDPVEIPCVSGGCSPCTCACPAEGECLPCECPSCDVQFTCTPTTGNFCVYHPVQCAADGDCKDGWACKAEEVCSGTSCACAPCAPDSECPACDCPEPTEPTCQTTGSWCQPKETACIADADCAAGFECIQRTTGGDCACPACACAPDTPDCPCDTCNCPAPTAEKVCLPTGWAAIGYATGTPEPDTSVPVNTGDVITTGKDGDVTTPPATPGAAESAAATPSGGSGCQSSPGAGSPLALMLLALGALIPMLRRRFPVRA